LAKIVQDLYILTQTGIVIFHRQFDESKKDQLFGGMMSALNSFAEQIATGGLTSFEIGGKRFTILKKGACLFIANSSSKVKEKKVLQELNEIATRFMDLYPEDTIVNWSGDMAVFADFEKKIEDSLEQTVKKLQKSFW